MRDEAEAQAFHENRESKRSDSQGSAVVVAADGPEKEQSKSSDGSLYSDASCGDDDVLHHDEKRIASNPHTAALSPLVAMHEQSVQSVGQSVGLNSASMESQVTSHVHSTQIYASSGGNASFSEEAHSRECVVAGGEGADSVAENSLGHAVYDQKNVGDGAEVPRGAELVSLTSPSVPRARLPVPMQTPGQSVVVESNSCVSVGGEEQEENQSVDHSATLVSERTVSPDGRGRWKRGGENVAVPSSAAKHAAVVAEENSELRVGRRKIGQTQIGRSKFIGEFFYGASEIFLRPRKTKV